MGKLGEEKKKGRYKIAPYTCNKLEIQIGGDVIVDFKDSYGKPEMPQAQALQEPEPEDIKRYDLGIEDYSKEIDEEEIDVD